MSNQPRYQPRFEVFPEKEHLEIRTYMQAPGEGDGVVTTPTGNFAWHFKDANGKLTHIGGQSFTRREDAHRAICGVVADNLSLITGMVIATEAIDPQRLPIIDLDEDGHVLAMTKAYDRAVTDRMAAGAEQ